MKNITYILLLFSLSVFGQRPNRFNDSTYFARPVRFEVPPYLIQGAGSGKVITSDANGRMTWQTFSSSGVSQGALNDSINAVRSIRKVDTLYRNLDSLVFKISGIRYAIKDSSGNGVTQQALDDSIARLDSTINAIPSPLLTLTDDSLNISGGNTIELPYIPLSGTRPNKPVTGDIEFKSGYDAVRLYKTNEDEDIVQSISFNDSHLEIKGTNVANTQNASIKLYADNVTIEGTGIGLRGGIDYSPNITDLDYTQKIYVDQRISDTATQIRSEIADTASSLHTLIDAKVSTTTLTDSLDKKTNKLISFNAYTTSDTLRLTDADKVIEMNVGTANNLVIPTNTAYAFPVGTQIVLIQIGAGQTTFVPASGVTVHSSGSKLKLTGQYSGATIIKKATNEWYLFGDITN